MTSEAKRQKLFSLLGDLPVKPDEIEVEKVKGTTATFEFGWKLR